MVNDLSTMFVSECVQKRSRPTKNSSQASEKREASRQKQPEKAWSNTKESVIDPAKKRDQEGVQEMVEKLIEGKIAKVVEHFTELQNGILQKLEAAHKAQTEKMASQLRESRAQTRAWQQKYKELEERLKELEQEQEPESELEREEAESETETSGEEEEVVVSNKKSDAKSKPAPAADASPSRQSTSTRTKVPAAKTTKTPPVAVSPKRTRSGKTSTK